MIVKANVAYPNGTRGYEWFLVRFDHTPVKDVTKRHRRTGLCSIYYLANPGEYEDGSAFASRICGEKEKFFVADAKVVCSEKDNYVKAYARNVTMKKAIQKIMTMQTCHQLDWDFTIDNETFKSFMTTLNKQHPHGMETAKKLLRDASYRHAPDNKDCWV
jgi:hypothetical protein